MAGESQGKRVKSMAVLAKPLHSKHRLQNIEDFIERDIGQAPQALDEAISIDCPQLISHNVALLSVDFAAHTKWVWMTTRRQGRHNEGAQVSIQFIGRDNDAGSCFPDFRSTRGIQGNKKDVPP